MRIIARPAQPLHDEASNTQYDAYRSRKIFQFRGRRLKLRQTGMTFYLNINRVYNTALHFMQVSFLTDFQFLIMTEVVSTDRDKTT